jgi:hypothetical protein
MDLKQNVQRLSKLVDSAVQEGIDLREQVQMDESIYNYSLRKRAQIIQELNQIITQLKSDSIIQDPNLKSQIDLSIVSIKESYGKTDLIKLVKEIKSLELLTKTLQPQNKELSYNIKNLPIEISEEIKVDLEEVQKCYGAACYRSAVILCARVLEIGLHRKYYDTTGVDLLEKSPGIGLGRIIQKLKEKEVTFDPGLTQQIHLINNIRIHAVHRQEKIFQPTQHQTLAIMLFTKDVLEKMF